MKNDFILSWILLVTSFFSASSCQAQTDVPHVDFKISSEVFVPNQKEPVSSNVTIFLENLVYDFRFVPNGNKPDEAAIYDSKSKKFTLLDYRRKLKLELDELQLIRLVDGMKSEISQSEKLKSVFLEGFSESADFEKHYVSVANSTVLYTARGIRPKNDRILQEYFRFLEVFTKVGVTDAKAIPPFPRLMLNSEIQKIGFIPTKVTLKISANSNWRRSMEAYSNHELSLQINEMDHSLTSDARNYWTTFGKVDIAKYRQIEVANSLDLKVKQK